ncbi:MAG: NAD-dependent epimerase/dehydratase family protein, partial [Spirochaetia bacterium]
MKILVTGAKGFIAGYLIEELLQNDYYVIGIDNNSKYGQLTKSFERHPKYEFIEGDAKHLPLMKQAIEKCDHFIAGAAMVGGISYFHEYAYDLIAENERITAAAFDAALWANNKHRLRKIT